MAQDVIRPLLAISLSDEQAFRLLADPADAERIDRLGLAFLLLGASRFAPADTGAVRLDPTALAAFVHHTVRRTGVLVSASPQRDHPYNLARRVSTDDHISGGRSGLLLGLRDHGAPLSTTQPGAWGGAGLGTGASLDAETLADVALAVRRLWQSWPVESIIADRESGQYARSELIKQVEHDGRFTLSGPFTVPTTPQGSPVLALYADTAALLKAAITQSDLVIVPQSAESGVLSSAVVATAEAVPGEPVRRRVLAGADVDGADAAELATLADRLAAQGVDGVVLDTVALDDAAVRRLLTDTVPALFDQGAFAPVSLDGTLRSRLGLAAVEPLLEDAASAFPA